MQSVEDLTIFQKDGNFRPTPPPPSPASPPKQQTNTINTRTLGRSHTVPPPCSQKKFALSATQPSIDFQNHYYCHIQNLKSIQNGMFGPKVTAVIGKGGGGGYTWVDIATS